MASGGDADLGVMRVAFAHHVWATLRLMDACAELDAELLSVTVPGVYGSVLGTFRHVVAGDASYLHLLTDGEVDEIDEDAMDLAALRATMSGFGATWEGVLASCGDPNRQVVRQRADGTSSGAPLAVRLAQVPHHGTEHRSHICTILTSLGIEPPELDLWAMALETGQMTES